MEMYMGLKSARTEYNLQNLKILGTLFLFILLLACLSACSGTVATAETSISLPTPTQVRLGPTSTLLPTATSEPIAIATPTLLPIPPVNENDHTRGHPEALITFLVYSDFQCPYCADFHQAWSSVQTLHPEDVRLVYRHFPLLSVHDKATLASAFAEIAGQQEKFWEMHDILFERREEWINLTPDGFKEWAVSIALELGIDPEPFNDESNVEMLQARMETAFEQGLEAGIPGTPFIFFNGLWYRLNPTTVNLEASIRLELLIQDQYSEPPQGEFVEGTLYFARLQLDRGEVVIQLFPNQAPATVASFLFLAEQGWFDGVGFHAVESGRIIESGDPTGTGLGGPGYLLLDELSDTLSFDEVGMLAMSSSGPNTNGSRFMINLVPLPHLNGSRTIFGQVVSGLEHLTALDNRDPLQDLFKPFQNQIKTITIEER